MRGCGMDVRAAVEYAKRLVNKALVRSRCVLLGGHPFHRFRIWLRYGHAERLQLTLDIRHLVREWIVLYDLRIIVGRDILALAPLENVAEHPERGIRFAVERVAARQRDQATRSRPAIALQVVVVRDAVLAFGE